MPDPIPVTIPLLNPNEPEASLATLHVQTGQPVNPGDLLCTLETTKSSAELYAEAAGFVVDIHCSPGQLVRAGDVLCYLADSPDWTPPERTPASTASPPAVPQGMRITQPALVLAAQTQVDLNQLPVGPLITEKTIQTWLAGRSAAALSPSESAFDPTAILVYGGGGHGKSLIDLLRSLHSYHIVGILDDGLPAGESIMGLAVLGGAAALPDLYARGVRLAVNAVGGIGNLAIRIQIFQRLAQAGFTCPAVVHPSAVVEPSADLSPGTQIFPQAYVGSEARVGIGTIVNTGAVVSHDCRLGDYVNISPGAILAGAVQVGSGVLVGMGATINLEVHLGAGARIGNGATVKSDVPEQGIVRAGAIWPE